MVFWAQSKEMEWTTKAKNREVKFLKRIEKKNEIEWTAKAEIREVEFLFNRTFYYKIG